MVIPNLHFYFAAARHRCSQRRFLLALALVFFWIIAESLQGEDTRNSWTYSDTHLRFALVEVIKLSACLGCYIWRRRRAHLRSDSYSTIPLEEHIHGADAFSDDLRLSPEAELEFPGGRSTRSGWLLLYPSPSTSFLSMCTVRSMLVILGIAVLHVLRAYVTSRTRDIADHLALNLVIPAATLCSLVVLRVFFYQAFSSHHLHAVLLQLSGLFIAKVGLISINPPPSHSTLIASILCDATTFTLIDLLYRSHQHSLLILNTILFAFGIFLHAFTYIFYSLFFAPITATHAGFSIAALILPVAEAGRDMAALLVIFYNDAVTEGVLVSFAAALSLLIRIETIKPFPFDVLAGCLIVCIALFTYISNTSQRTDEKTDPKSEENQAMPGRRTIGATVTFCVAIAYTVFVVLHEKFPSLQSASVFSVEPMDASIEQANCHRRPLPSISYFEPRTYHNFDNVLLIVFFSHARYNGNLDFYKEVYSEFFPNIIFIGPASREDAGFSHSYDVFVDSYQSDEDLSDPSFYKMAGRMAHHMLYTAMKEHDCYDGYLWAPFDTLLNIPRLQQFDQNFFWYHSPWAQYVPNPAHPDAKANQHAPSAILSLDPFLNLTETWRGWEYDWWWGDPHVGVNVCMEAFLKVPFQMRKRLELFTDGVTRFIGGSADTLYIPGRHRQKFLDVLGLFLETDCFLEIATPTAVHLVVPLNEPILFVDHWWIFQPPFNASFVRQKWAEGYEVDTFHTFHWGDVDADGVWTGNHGHVDDVRHLLAESGVRQGVNLNISSL